MWTTRLVSNGASGHLYTELFTKNYRILGTRMQKQAKKAALRLPSEEFVLIVTPQFLKVCYSNSIKI